MVNEQLHSSLKPKIFTEIGNTSLMGWIIVKNINALTAS